MLQAQQVLQERYQLQQKLSDNPVRQTWLATDLATPEAKTPQVVVKLLAFGGQVQWDNVKLFEREAQVLKQLDHPRIPKYRDYFCIDEQTLWFGLVEEYIPGASLKELLAEGKKFTALEIRKVATTLLETLIYLHSLSPAVLHRDIKPSNVIWGEDDQIYLVDFGAVQDRAVAEGGTFTVVGTYGYTPIEQFGGRAVPASDLYALGATLIHLLTGVAPADLPQKDLRIQFRDRVGISPDLVDWIEALTEPALERRFRSATEALSELQAGSSLTRSQPRDLAYEPRRLTSDDAPDGSRVRIVNRTPDELVIEVPDPTIRATVPLVAIACCSFFIFCLFMIFGGNWGWAFTFLVLTVISGFFIYGCLCPIRVYFNRNIFVIYKKLPGYIPQLPDGVTDDIEDVFQDNVRVTNRYSSGTERKITLQAGIREYSFGQGLSRVECLWLVQHIREWLELA